MNDIDNIINMLHWGRPEDEQALGREMGMKVKCLKAFCMPIYGDIGKSVWDNCALILSVHTDDELTPYLDDLLHWLQDLNWPGAWTILQRLIRFGKTYELAWRLDHLVWALNQLGDNSWLDNLSHLLENPTISNHLQSSTIKILEHHIC